MIQASPLLWPFAQGRVPPGRRAAARFKVTLAESRNDLLRELSLLGAKNIVISSNLELMHNGLPYANSREPEDPGIAVYFDRKTRVPNGSYCNGVVTSGFTEESRPFVIACDSYTRAAHNLRAVGVTVAALRSIARHGASGLLEQAFTGFAALPPAGSVKPWWEVLGLDVDATANEVRAAFLTLSKIHHPDVTGGDHGRMSEINEAYRQAKEGK
jgi:DnaJ domain